MGGGELGGAGGEEGIISLNHLNFSQCLFFLVGWEEGESFAGFKWFIIFIWNGVASWIIHFSATADGIKSNSFCTIVSLPRPFLSLYILAAHSLYIQTSLLFLPLCVILLFNFLVKCFLFHIVLKSNVAAYAALVISLISKLSLGILMSPCRSSHARALALLCLVVGLFLTRKHTHTQTRRYCIDTPDVFLLASCCFSFHTWELNLIESWMFELFFSVQSV